MRWFRAVLAAAAVVAGISAMPATASAAWCPTGYFCAWEHAYYSGEQVNWYDNDYTWGWNISDDDSSWQNAAIRGSSGGYDKVKVYDCYWLTCGVTVYLQPGQSIGYSASANDRGSSHKWVRGW